MPNAQTRCRIRVQLVQRRVQMQKQMARRRCVVNFVKPEHFFKHLKEKAKYTLYIVHAYHFLITGGA